MTLTGSTPVSACTAPAWPDGAPLLDAVLSPLGIPLQIELGVGVDAAVLTQACRGWQGPSEAGQQPLQLRVRLDPKLVGDDEPDIVVDRGWVRLSGPGAVGAAAVDTRTAACAVSPALGRDPERLRETVLDPLVLSMLAHLDRTPIHASGLVAGGLAILACGPSGAGKSSLALAADEAGWPVLSDDTVYLQTEPRLRVWGIPRAAHLLPSDTAESGRMRIRNGKRKRVVGFRSTPPQTFCADRAVVCVLRFGRRAALQPITQAEALRRLGKLEPGFDLFPRESRRAHELLTANGAWLLTLSANPAEAIEVLAGNNDLLAASAMPNALHA